jgi:hypothetical protein
VQSATDKGAQSTHAGAYSRAQTLCAAGDGLAAQSLGVADMSLHLFVAKYGTIKLLAVYTHEFLLANITPVASAVNIGSNREEY